MTHMQALGQIVVGVDGSAASAAAVGWAVQEARLRHASVHLVCAHDSHAVLRAPYASWTWVTRQDERYAAARALLIAMAELARGQLPPGRLTTELADEPPVRALLDRAAKAEMLVLGTTRPAPESGLPPRVMGPVARDCLRLAHCPVVVVAPDDQPGAHSPAPRRHVTSRRNASGAAVKIR